MNILSIFKLFTTLLQMWSDYVTKKKIEAEIAKEAQDEIDKQVIIAQSARDDAYKLPVDDDEFNRDNKKDSAM